MSEQAPEPVIVRVASASDLGSIGDVERDAGQRFAAELPSIAADDAVPLDRLRSAITEGRVVVAAADRAVIGYAWWSILDSEAHLEQVSVVRQAEGRGIGRRLIEWTVAEARRRGLSAMTLTTFRDIAWNGPLYERYGFVSLDDSALPPGLAERRRSEREAGLDVAQRVAMRRPF